MDENAILTKLNSVENELQKLAGVIRANDSLLQNLSDKIGNKLSRQVFTVRDLSIRWNCSENHARDLISHYRIPLVLARNKQPRKPHCVLLSELVKFERGQGDGGQKTAINLAPPMGKSARGFSPFENSEGRA